MKTELEAGSCLKAFLDQEQSAALERMQKVRKRAVIWMIVAVPACLLGTFLLGFFLSKDILLGLAHMKYSVYLIALCEVGIILGAFCQNPAKKYVKHLKKEIANQLPDGGTQEEFAFQMTGGAGSGSLRRVQYTQDGREESVSITRDYALMRYGIELCAIVRLKDVERIELNVRYHSTCISANNALSFINSKSYPIFFFYYKMGEIADNDNPDVMFGLQDRGKRDEVIAAIRELTHA